MKTSLSRVVTEISSQIKRGEAAAARVGLSKAVETKVPRSEAVQIASLARRLNLPLLAIRVLGPIIRPGRKLLQPASPAEQVEYAASLIKIGAQEEALGILNALDAARVPEVLLFKSFALTPEWNYADTIPLLEAFISHPQVEAYQKLVGKINLAAALVYERQRDKASAMLESFLEETAREKHYLLYSNGLQLCAQNAIFHDRWKEAEKFLEESERKIKGAGNVDELFVNKWKAILELKRSGGSAASLARVRKIRADAVEHQHWETVRDCDRFEAVATTNRALAQHVYLGTPHVSFRERLTREFGSSLSLPPEYLWSLGGKGKKAPVLSLWSGEKPKAGEALKVGQALHRLLHSLSLDFYRPIRLAALHSRLYPGDYFNLNTSPGRTHRVIWRFRSWVEESKLPLVVDEFDGFYRLSASSPCRLKIPTRSEPTSKQEVVIEKLRAKWGAATFTAPQANALLGGSLRSTLYLLSACCRDGRLVQSGKARATTYCLRTK